MKNLHVGKIAAFSILMVLRSVPSIAADAEKKCYTSSNVFIVNTCDYRVAKENYSFNGESGGPSFYTYDDKGMLIEKVFTRSDGFETKTSFDYDETGLLKESHRKYADGLEGGFTYEYDKNRKLTRRIFKRSDGLEGLEVYEYGENGLLSKARYEKFDTWLTGTLTFDHDSNGFLAKGYFKGENGFDADITFENDSKGNVTKIHWEFTFGKTQTYWFEYEKIK